MGGAPPASSPFAVAAAPTNASPFAAATVQNSIPVFELAPVSRAKRQPLKTLKRYGGIRKTGGLKGWKVGRKPVQPLKADR